MGWPNDCLERLAADNDLHRPTVGPAHDGFGGRRRVSRILRLAGLLSAAAAIAIGVWLHGGGSTNPAEQQVLDEAIRSFIANGEPGAIGSKAISPTGYPWSQWIVQVAGTRCRALDGFLGRPGVAYDLPGLGGVHAVLYVVCPATRWKAFDIARRASFYHGRLLRIGLAGEWIAVCPGGQGRDSQL